MDWIKTGWGSKFKQEFDEKSQFYVDITAIGPVSNDPVAVAINTVNSITETHPGPYYLMLSGGADSLSMLWAWIKSGKEFNAISVEYVNNKTGEVMNDHDLAQLKSFAKEHNVTVKYIQFDILHFLETHLEEYAIKYRCTSPQIVTHMKISEFITDGTIVFSGNHMVDSLGYTYTIFGLARYAKWSKRSIIPFFFMHDANIAGSIVREVIHDGKSNPNNNIPIPEEFQNSDFLTRRYIGHYTKINRLLRGGFPVHPQKIKYTGFEKIKEYYANTKISLIERLEFADNLTYPSTDPFDIMFRHRLTRKIKYKSRIAWITK